MRIADEERKINPYKEYCVVKNQSQEKKIDEAGVYSAVQYKKGDWIVKISWYEFSPYKTNRVEDRFYKNGESQWIPCGSIVRSIKPSEVAIRWSGQNYRMSKEVDNHIVNHGDLLF